MVAKNYFKLAVFLLFFVSLKNYVISEDKLSNNEIEINDAAERFKQDKLKIIDIRTIKEWKMTGVIPGSFLINMHNEDYSENTFFIEKVEEILNQNNNFNIAFICASGARSEIAVNFFMKKFNNLYHIPKGILGKERDGWIYLGFPLEDYNTD